MDTTRHLQDAVWLLERLIATPRVSRDEDAAATLLCDAMQRWGLRPERHANNVWAVSSDMRPERPTLLLNAHIDTVRPVASWTRPPHCPIHDDGRLYGLGANDCGGGLVTLLQVFRMMAGADCPYNLVFLASAEEEVSGDRGVALALPLLPPIDVAIVGEPTGMQPAVAERGLMVIDGYARGVSGHAARGEGVNAIYEALDDLLWLRDYRSDAVSPLLGPTKVSVTVIEGGTQHNVVPDSLHFIIDVRTNELETNEAVFDRLQRGMRRCRLEPRSFRLQPSSIDMAHPLVQRCVGLGLKPFGSPTLSDQAQMSFPSLKLGPGQSSRSHTADEYIMLSEIDDALRLYAAILAP